MKKAEEYVSIIMHDDREKIVSETPTVYQNDRIERVYEFADGAVVKYEWQDISLNQFNHRFTLVKPSMPNSAQLEPGVIKVINY